MTTARQLPAKSRPTIKSRRQPCCWQLWLAGRGHRTIEHFRDGVRTTVAHMRTARKWERATAERPAGRTVVTWKVYDDTGFCYGEYNSDRAAFKAFCSSL